MITDEKLKKVLTIIGFEISATTYGIIYFKYNKNIVRIAELIDGTYQYTYQPINSLNIKHEYGAVENFITILKKEFKYELRKHTIRKLLQ